MSVSLYLSFLCVCLKIWFIFSFFSGHCVCGWARVLCTTFQGVHVHQSFQKKLLQIKSIASRSSPMYHIILYMVPCCAMIFSELQWVYFRMLQVIFMLLRVAMVTSESSTSCDSFLSDWKTLFTAPPPPPHLLMGSIQVGIQQSVGSLGSSPERWALPKN